MGRKRNNFFWHVAQDGWFQSGPDSAATLQNIGRDIVLVLVDSEEPTGSEPVVPENDSFVIERVIGQWKLSGFPTSPGDEFFIHERIYVVDFEPGAIAIRSLDSQREADTSFLYHQVTAWHNNWDNDKWGNWRAGTADTVGVDAFRMGGPNFRDVKVGRRLNEGQALIYHWQMEGVTIPPDNVFHLQCWLRTLVREG